MARDSDAVLETVAGPEIGVASTKAFTAQLSVLACLAIALAGARGTVERAREAELIAALLDLPGRGAEVLALVDAASRRVAEQRGRGARRALPRPRQLHTRSRWRARSS